MIVTLELQVADTPCKATINTATKTVIEVIAEGYRPISRDPVMDQEILKLWAAGRLKEAGVMPARAAA